MEKPLTEHMDPGRPLDLAGYLTRGGYRALQKALNEMSPAAVIGQVKEAGLRGRGGAGFPTGLKWSFVPPVDKVPPPRYLLANGDELEPGTFKDRFLVEGNPHQLIEGIILASYAIQANVAYVFLRWAYQRAARILQEAIDEAYRERLLGENIQGSGYRLDLYLHTSAGRYICGEETALINALEGRRANPRTKPPFPPVAGLWARPTIVNNIETLCNVPHILEKGPGWYKALSRGPDGGTKIFGASGRVVRPGLWELPMGTPIREILEDHAGGMQSGYSLRGLLPGGASTDFLVEEHLDVPMDFESVAKAGSRMGTGTMIVLDDKSCPVGAVHNLIRFFARESCGWCTPCRDGLPLVEKTLRALEQGEGRVEDIALLERHCKFLGPGYTFCPLAPGAVEPLQSALKYFREDFDRHVKEKKCPWR